jgi:hypothetical protein
VILRHVTAESERLGLPVFALLNEESKKVRTTVSWCFVHCATLRRLRKKRFCMPMTVEVSGETDVRRSQSYKATSGAVET